MTLLKPDYCRPCVGFPWDNGKGFSRVTGENRVPILFVGEGSGRTEVRKGEPFVGKAGEVLNDALRTAGLRRADYSITNLIRCFSGNTQVYLPDGSRRRIADLVESNYSGEVLSFDGQTKQFVSRKVIAVHKTKRDNRKLYKVSYRGCKETGKGKAGAVATEDHEFLTEVGWVRADSLRGLRLNVGPHGLGERRFQVAVGSLLGDATIPKASAHLQWVHSVAQREWSEAKARVFNAKVSEPRKRKDGDRGNDFVTACTKATRGLADLRHEFYSSGKKRVPTWVRLKLKPQGLATWFLDDGCIRAGRTPLAEFATCAFSSEDLDVLLDALWVNGLEGYKQRGRICLNAHNTELMVQMISPFVPSSMRYKLGTSKWLFPFDASWWDYEPPVPLYAPALVSEYTGELSEKSRSVYCLSVDGTNNFVTPAGVVHNCGIPDNKLLRMPYEYPALNHCRKYLNDVVAERQPKVIVALGEIPLRELSMMRGRQAELHSFVLPSIYPDCHIIGTYHPSRIARGEWRLFGVLMHDIRQAVRFATSGIPERRETRYLHNPSANDIRDYLLRLEADPSLPVSYDCETPELIGQQSDGKTIMLMQFSSEVGTGMALTPDQFDAARLIMQTPNPKWGWADRTFDRPLLRSCGWTLNGTFHDLMNAAAHLQPDFVSSKDANDTEDKQVPAQLMSLQSWVSLQEPWELPWKHMVKAFMEMHPQANPMPTVKEYGCRDVDHAFRVGERNFASLRRLNLYDGYWNFKVRFAEVLDLIHDNGLPVDAQGQAEVKEFIEAEEERLLRELQASVPEELQALHPEFGYVSTPKFEQIDNYDAVHPPYIKLSNSRGLLVQRMVTAEVVNYVEVECVACAGVGTVAGVRRPKKCSKCKATGKRQQKDGRISRDELRWAIALFNPNSHDHIIRYLEHRGYDIPLDIDTGRPTTGQKEIETLIIQTDDPVLKLIRKSKKLTKLGGTYCGGDWIPGEDGRVHGTFRFGTSSGQTSCTGPNQQQWPTHFDPTDEWIKPIMERIKACIKAPPGRVFVKIDAKGAHSRMQAWLAEDADYYRLSNLGTHAFNTAHYVGVPDKDSLLELDDEALTKRLKEIKKQYDYEYNFAKRVSFNMQYLGGAEKAAHTLRVPVIEVIDLMDRIKGLYPRSFKTFPESVQKMLRESPMLRTAFDCCRRIWNEDAQQGVAFIVASHFHCHWQAGLIRQFDQGLLHKYPIVNFCHDDEWLLPTEDLAEQCIAECREELERPSDVLINSLGAFQVGTEVQWGYDMLNLQDA